MRKKGTPQLSNQSIKLQQDIGLTHIDSGRGCGEMIRHEN